MAAVPARPSSPSLSPSGASVHSRHPPIAGPRTSPARAGLTPRSCLAHLPRRPFCFASVGVSTLLVSAFATRRLSAQPRQLPPLPSSGFSSPPPAPSQASFSFTSAAMANVSIGTPAMKPIIIPPKQEHKATVVFLHGLGDTGEGWADIPGTLHLPNVKWVFPSAPIKPVSLNGGFPMPSWFDIYGLSPDSREDKVGIDLVARYVAGILAEEKAAAPPGVKLVVGGFSQGGAVSLHLTVRKYLGSFVDGTDASEVPVDGTICLSGWLPLGEYARDTPLKSPEAAAKHPILECHGQADALVMFALGKQSAEALKSLGFSSLKFKSYPGLAHSACPEELQDVKAWLDALVASPSL